MSWSITRHHIQLGNLFLLDWGFGLLFQIPSIGFGIWVGKLAADGSWSAVVD